MFSATFYMTGVDVGFIPCGSGASTNTSQHLNVSTTLKCLEEIWEPFHVGLRPQPMHLDIICSPAVIQESGKNHTFLVKKNGDSGLMVEPSPHLYAYECSQPPFI